MSIRRPPVRHYIESGRTAAARTDRQEVEMKYMLALFNEERDWSDTSPEEGRAAMKAWDDYTAALRDSDAFIAGEGLSPSATATTIRLAEEPITTDGPFAETKEQLAGFYLIEVDDLDAAIEWGRRIPMPGGAVEVRPVMDYDAAGGSSEHTKSEVAS
jgi:hypothetical protein